MLNQSNRMFVSTDMLSASDAPDSSMTPGATDSGATGSRVRAPALRARPCARAPGVRDCGCALHGHDREAVRTRYQLISLVLGCLNDCGRGGALDHETRGVSTYVPPCLQKG